MKEAIISSLIKDSFQFLPKALRLGFHDCVGGCNGCVNLELPANNGLKVITDALDEVYYGNKFYYIVSKADFWALSAVMAVELGLLANDDTSSCPMTCFNLKWGRQDQTDCSRDNNQFPSPKMNGDTMFKYFQDEFGFSRYEVTALLGAHTLGGAAQKHSGYEGVWIPGEELVFNEKFYRNMISDHIQWLNVNIDDGGRDPKWQFLGFTHIGDSAGFMLNTDFEIFYNLTLDNDGKLTCKLDTSCGPSYTCDGKDCPMANTFLQAYKYSQDCYDFIKDFQRVFEKMLTHPYYPDELTSTYCPCEH